jgi:hypothetical protein
MPPRGTGALGERADGSVIALASPGSILWIEAGVALLQSEEKKSLLLWSGVEENPS